MRNRLERGRLNKAQRGELFQHVPWGYVKVSPEQVEMDPDEQVRDVIRLIFDKYDEIGSVWGVFHYLVRNHIRLGIRPFQGPNRGNLEWRRATMTSVRPAPAASHVRGRLRLWPPLAPRVRTATGERTRQGNWLPMEQWKVLKRDCLPAYITWERYLANQECCASIAPLPAPRGAPAMGPVCSPASSSAATAAVASRRIIQLTGRPITAAPTSLRSDRAGVFRPQSRRG